MKCKICASNTAKHKFNLTDKLSVYSCSNCSVMFMDPQLSDEEITALYSEQYYKAWGISGPSENDVSKQMKIDTFQLRLNQIQKHVKSGKVLDIGCATGFFLEAAQSRGFDPYGIEFSEYSSKFAKKKFGENAIFNGKLEDCDFPEAMFDVITMFDLIEHVRVPTDILAKAAKLLKPDGIIMITTPHSKSRSNKMMGTRWTHYKKEHFFYFDKTSLDYIAKENNLEMIFSGSSKKALNVYYLQSQFNVYKHWLFTPLINFAYAILPKSLASKNFHIEIGEIEVVLKKKH